MKKLLLLLVWALSLGITAQAQTPSYFSSNTSTTANFVPFNPGGNSTFRKVQDIYGPGEFVGAPAGRIDTLWIRVASEATFGAGPYSDFEISMGQNIGANTEATTSFNTGLVSVYSNNSFTTAPLAVDGWLAIPLSSPFLYDPDLSLVIEVKSTAISGAGFNVYRSNNLTRRVYGEYGAATGTTINGPMNLGISIPPPYFNSDTSTIVNTSPFNRGTTSSLRKAQEIYGPHEFAGAPDGLLHTVWIRTASTVATDTGPYSGFEISLGQNIGTNTTTLPSFNSGLTSVYSSNSFTTPPVAENGWLAIPLSSPFQYNADLSLVVQIRSSANTLPGFNVYRSAINDRRLLGDYAATTGMAFSGPIDLGISVFVEPPYLTGNTSLTANVVPLNPGSNSTFRKVQEIYGPGEFVGAPAGSIDTVWMRVASNAGLGAGPYFDFEISMGQNIGTNTTSTTSFNTGLTSVYSNSSFKTPAIVAGEWLAISLPTPFPYNPALSLVTEVKSSGAGGIGLNVYRSNHTSRRVYGAYAGTTGTVFNGPTELGLSIGSTIFHHGFE